MAVDFKKPGGKEFLIIGGSVAGLALLYFWWKNRQASNTAAANQAASTANSPTALLMSWIHDHQSSSTSTKPGTVTVPNVVGMTDTEGDAAITALGLKVHDTNEKKGGSGGSTKIASQSPAGGTQVAPGSSVSVTLATTGSKVNKGSG